MIFNKMYLVVGCRSDDVMENQSTITDGAAMSVAENSAKCSLQSSAIDNDDNLLGPFYFESDHVALKGNKDYHALLHAWSLLDAQRSKAINDLDVLVKVRDEALDDPIAFVSKLQVNGGLHLPSPQTIADIPEISWDKYISSMDEFSAGHKHMTRHKKPTQDSGKAKSVNSDSSICGQSSKVIRGRLKDESKSSTFNQLWTPEEQQYLEELLLKYPPEEVENRRWEKIANELPNRTPQQVTSRVQKYFIKLAKAGLPIPGRMPNVGHYIKKGLHRHQRLNRFLFQPSTFMTSHEPVVYMSDNDDHDSQYSMDAANVDDLRDATLLAVGDCDVSDDEDINPEMKNTDEYLELLQLKRLHKQREIEESGYVQHLGYKCDRCECEPIIGTRWHCADCPTDIAVDFCEDCVDCIYETDSHRSDHKLIPIRVQQGNSNIDRDYTRFTPGAYNYLDPNYMPAT